MIQVHLVDLNPSIVAAWKLAFEGEPHVHITQGSMLDKDVDVWVTPTNSRGNMSGGLDAVIKNHFGPQVENAVKSQIVSNYNGFMPVGRATIVDLTTMTVDQRPRFLVSTPTMEGESDDLRRTKNTALACAAAFQAIYAAIDAAGSDGGRWVESVALPGLGAGTGKVSPEMCAELMKVGYTLFRRKRYVSFEEMLDALNAELVEAGKPQIAAVAPPKESTAFLPEGFPPSILDKVPAAVIEQVSEGVPEYNIGTPV
jgi:O-acetyl-ADP-ribose deacetylase (regulator of RNase III)